METRKARDIDTGNTKFFLSPFTGLWLDLKKVRVNARTVNLTGVSVYGRKERFRVDSERVMTVK